MPSSGAGHGGGQTRCALRIALSLSLSLSQLSKSSQSFLEKYPTNVHGEFDMMYDKMHGFFSDWGEGSKDANFTIDQMLLNIIARKREGNKVLILVNDCGGHQHNQHVVGFAKLLVDHGFFEVVLLVREPSTAVLAWLSKMNFSHTRLR